MKKTIILVGINLKDKKVKARKYKTLAEALEIVNSYMDSNKYSAETLQARLVSWSGQSNTGYTLPTKDSNIVFELFLV